MNVSKNLINATFDNLLQVLWENSSSSSTFTSVTSENTSRWATLLEKNDSTHKIIPKVSIHDISNKNENSSLENSIGSIDSDAQESKPHYDPDYLQMYIVSNTEKLNKILVQLHSILDERADRFKSNLDTRQSLSKARKASRESLQSNFPLHSIPPTKVNQLQEPFEPHSRKPLTRKSSEALLERFDSESTNISECYSDDWSNSPSIQKYNPYSKSSSNAQLSPCKKDSQSPDQLKPIRLGSPLKEVPWELFQHTRRTTEQDKSDDHPSSGRIHYLRVQQYERAVSAENLSSSRSPEPRSPKKLGELHCQEPGFNWNPEKTVTLEDHQILTVPRLYDPCTIPDLLAHEYTSMSPPKVRSATRLKFPQTDMDDQESGKELDKNTLVDPQQDQDIQNLDSSQHQSPLLATTVSDKESETMVAKNEKRSVSSNYPQSPEKTAGNFYGTSGRNASTSNLIFQKQKRPSDPKSRRMKNQQVIPSFKRERNSQQLSSTVAVSGSSSSSVPGYLAPTFSSIMSSTETRRQSFFGSSSSHSSILLRKNHTEPSCQDSNQKSFQRLASGRNNHTQHSAKKNSIMERKSSYYHGKNIISLGKSLNQINIPVQNRPGIPSNCE